MEQDFLLDENLLWWIVQIIITIIDFFMIYCVTHAMLKQKIMLNYKHIGLMVLLTVAITPLYFLGTYVNRLAMFLHFYFVKSVSEQKTGDALIIYGLGFAMAGIIQAPISGIVLLSYELLNFQRPFVFLISQLITAVGFVFICKKLKLYRWFYALKANIVLKLLLLMTTLILLIVAFFIKYEYQFSYFLFFSLFTLLMIVALFPVFLKIYANTTGLISMHDLENSLSGTILAIQYMDDPEEIRKEVCAHSKEFGVNADQFNEKRAQGRIDRKKEYVNQINAFIQAKSQKKGIEIVSEIDYHDEHKDASFRLAIKWLGTLMDNALEASVNNPIYIQIRSTPTLFALEVSNEFVGDSINIESIFERGYTTKETGRGIGLYNLYSKVKELGGAVLVETFYSEKFNCEYLHIRIMFAYDPYEAALKRIKESKMAN